MEVILIENTIICRCEGVTLKHILQAIELGATNTKELKLMTRVGMGVCQGKVCRPMLEEFIAEQTNVHIEMESKLTTNVPVRSLTLRQLARHGKDA